MLAQHEGCPWCAWMSASGVITDINYSGPCVADQPLDETNPAQDVYYRYSTRSRHSELGGVRLLMTRRRHTAPIVPDAGAKPVFLAWWREALVGKGTRLRRHVATAGMPSLPRLTDLANAFAYPGATERFLAIQACTSFRFDNFLEWVFV